MESGIADPPSAKGQLAELIRSCLNLNYISKSCQNEIETGNHYQSVRLGDVKTSGFRTDRSEFLDKINFNSTRVLDLGSNLGEMSRTVRDRGADIVDGFEYDHFFIEIAQLLNAYNSTTRVSFFQRDITNEASYGGQYDIVMAFAVWTYVGPKLGLIAQMTDVLLLETHNLHGNLQRDYVDRLDQYFPSHTYLGDSDWGRTHGPSGGRAVLLCAKNDAALEQAMHSGA